MLRILEMSWLALTLISGAITCYQFFATGWISGSWMLCVTLFATVMYRVRRRQRLESEDPHST